MSNIRPDDKNLHIVPELAQPVGHLWQRLQISYIQTRGSFNVASPLSNTPRPVYKWIHKHAANFPWENVNFILMDEQVEGRKAPFRYISSKDPASYERFAAANLLDALPDSIPLLKPELHHLTSFNPPIHLLILALGVKGNYANVMPGTPLNTGWHVAQLIDEFKQVHTQKGAYAGAAFRTQGMSLGPQQVLGADHVVVLASGTAKRTLVRELFSYTNFDPSFPISIVHHPDVRARVEFYITPDAMDNTQV